MFSFSCNLQLPEFLWGTWHGLELLLGCSNLDPAPYSLQAWSREQPALQTYIVRSSLHVTGWLVTCPVPPGRSVERYVHGAHKLLSSNGDAVSLCRYGGLHWDPVFVWCRAPELDWTEVVHERRYFSPKWAASWSSCPFQDRGLFILVMGCLLLA